ncbi:hypothetical protein GCM10010277_31040 [Streptomyces longisporoflavus]|uniref:hypothetical protein n=1 Tax=Streptomyces longisporoflavus TaxID=28044 RepID=UPI00167E2991|nr:hypothetical protein [Streptomyces longisporoflavus]GGV41950.1 hypothetical protein GCM10010277_31040 [Streptomyces longisporoflavus]
MLLRDYDRHGRTWALDPATGLLSPASGRCHGFVHVADEAAALYADPSDAVPVLWLQYGRRRWDCAAVTVRQSVAPDGSRRFTVRDARGAALELRYPAPDPGPFDPAYDWIDAEADDFFLWAAGRLTDADASSRTTLLAHFRAGFLPD